MKSFFGFGFPFFVKTILPGIIGTLLIWPLICFSSMKIGIDKSIFANTFLTPELIFIGLIIFIGFTVNFLDDFIYRLYEGYILWPEILRKKLTQRLNKKIAKLKIIKEETSDPIKKRILWEKLMKFPLKEERTETDTQAYLPTRLGNIIYSYEDYPNSRYGMSSMFFWDRIWLAIDKETRNEIKGIWAHADCMLYISFVFMLSSLLYFLVFFLDILNIPTLILGKKVFENSTTGIMPSNTLIFLGAGIVFMILSYLFYLMSLPLHYKNGMIFQSLFDLYRDKLKVITEIRESDKKKWKGLWSYLKYGLIQCDKCSKYYPAHMDECPHCKNIVKNSS